MKLRVFNIYNFIYSVNTATDISRFNFESEQHIILCTNRVINLSSVLHFDSLWSQAFPVAPRKFGMGKLVFLQPKLFWSARERLAMQVTFWLHSGCIHHVLNIFNYWPPINNKCWVDVYCSFVLSRDSKHLHFSLFFTPDQLSCFCALQSLVSIFDR